MTSEPPTIAQLAGNIARTDDEDIRWRLLLAFVDEYGHADVDVRPALFVDEPPVIGDRRWDVMLAAVAEHLSYEGDVAAPAWVRQPSREWLGFVWWVVPYPSARAWALAHSPAAFRRRGIFLHPDDLNVA